MILTLSLTPLVNFVLLLTASSYLSLPSLLALVIGAMFASLGALLFHFPSLVTGSNYTADLGVWVSSGLFDSH